MNRRAFSLGVVIIIVAAIIIAGGAWYYIVHQSSTKTASTSGAVSSSTSASTNVPIASATISSCSIAAYSGTTPLSALPYYYPNKLDTRGGMTCVVNVTSTLPLFYLHFPARADNLLDTFTITEGNSSSVLQTLNLTSDGSGVYASDIAPGNFSTIINNDDSNFDGYNDIEIPVDVSANGNETDNVYQYQSSTNQFVYNEFLSGLSNIYFNTSTMQVEAGWTGDIYDYDNETYQYHSSTKAYILIQKQVASSIDDANGEPTGRVLMTISQLQSNGIMKVVTTTSDNSED